MIQFTPTTWHRESYDRFLQERLPELLAERLPLSGYSAEFTSDTSARVIVSIDAGAGEVSTVFDLPRPDADGCLWITVSNGEKEGGPAWRHGKVVLPYADNEDLTVANIACIGERLLEHVDERLGQSTDGLPWDEALLRSWVPLERWLEEFFAANAQWLDKTNWLAIRVHLRRLVIPNASGDLAHANIGLVSPIETPEGPNVNKIFGIAAGATIRDGKLISVEDRPEAGFGVAALMIPFIEHSSDARLIMSCNMMRQWLPQARPEPALVQTGNEPAAPEFWCGRNLLTAYVPWGESTFEDAVVISESAANRFPTDIAVTQSYRAAYQPFQAGDWLSNRHGAKCTIARILPDAEMPHLDGVPVDLVYSPCGVTSRLNLGQLWEAAASRIAQSTGEPLIAPSFRGPTQSELRAKFAELGFPEDGLGQLTAGKDGPALESRSCVGWVYWGRLDHEPADWLSYSTGDQAVVGNKPQTTAQWLGYLEYAALRDIGAFQTIRELYHARSTRHAGASTLAARVAAGTVEQSGAPSPAFDDLKQRLAAAGVQAEIREGVLAFGLVDPDDGLKLVRPVAHPWLRDAVVRSVGEIDGVEGFADLVRVNAQVDRLAGSGAPATLIRKGMAELEAAVADYFEALVGPDALRWDERVLFSGCAVLSPGEGLDIDEVELPEELAWGLFRPMAVRELGDADAVDKRTPAASKALDTVMARSRVLLHASNLYTQPEEVYAPLLAVRPRRGDGVVVRIHNRVTSLMNVDFDGDRINVFLPVTESGQKEAKELLTPQSYVKRDPRLIEALRPSMDAMWGLARMSLDENGREELAALGIDPLPEAPLTKAALTAALTGIAERDGIDAAIDTAERLRLRGFKVARMSGWSIGPFLGHSLSLPPKPGEEEWLEQWPRFVEEVTDLIDRKSSFDDNDVDPLRLSILSGARGITRQLLVYLIGWGSVESLNNDLVPIRHGLVEGLTPAESTALALSLRRRWYRDIRREMSLGSPRNVFAVFGPIAPLAPPNVEGRHVLARAMRARYPGAVFARAAAFGEVDPLTGRDSRLFAGLPPS